MQYDLKSVHGINGLGAGKTTLLNRILTTEHGKWWQAAIVGFLVLFFALLITLKRALSGHAW